ncbi:MAG: hypothetical protein WCJ35_11980 [Planctomycetota bacterium]
MRMIAFDPIFCCKSARLGMRCIAIALSAILLPCHPTCAETRVAVIASQGASVEKVVPLVELRLGQKKDIVLLERENVKKVLREQELSALTAAEGTAKRIALGKLLKADLLVAIRGQEKPAPQVEIIVCETRHGLRLCHAAMPSADPETTATAIVKLVEQALVKHEGQIKEIVAVPPLVSNDLGFESQALQKPLACLIQQALVARSGLLVVELEEAKAISEELAATGGEIQRPLPLYLLGEFRHQGFGPEAKLSVVLTLKRGSRELEQRTLAELPTGDVAQRLRSDATAMIDKAVGTAVAPPDATAEARQLAEAARRMFELASFLECVDLAEASLLLKPEDADLHRIAAQALSEHLTLLYVRPGAPADFGQKNEALYRRMAPHVESFMLRLPVRHRDFLIIGLFTHYPDKKAMCDMMLRVLAAKQKTKMHDDTLNLCSHCVDKCVAKLPEDEQYRWKLAAAQAWPVERVSRNGLITLISMLTYGDRSGDLPRMRNTIKALRTSENPLCNAAADVMERRLNEGRHVNDWSDDPPKVQNYTPPPEPDPVKDGPEAHLLLANLKGKADDWMPAGRVLDERRSGKELAVSGGRIPPFAEIHDFLYAYMTDLGSFDGRLNWFVQRSTRPLTKREAPDEPPRVLVVDPATGQSWTMSQEDGVPSTPLIAATAVPLGPGKACIVGAFGEWRKTGSWIAIAEVKPGTGKKSFRVIHEAQKFPAPGKEGDWSDPHRGFMSARGYVLVDSSPGGGKRHIAFERGGQVPFLLVDPETLTVRVAAAAPDPVFPGFPVGRQDGIYWIDMDKGGSYSVRRFGPPDFKVERSPVASARGSLTFHGQWSVLVDVRSDVWVARNPMGEFRRLRTVFDRPKDHRMDFDMFHVLSTRQFGLLGYDYYYLFQIKLPSDEELAALLDSKRGGR